MESRSGKWDIFIKFASSFEVLSFSIRFFAKFGRHFVSYLFGKPLAYRKRAAGIVGDGLFIGRVLELFYRVNDAWTHKTCKCGNLKVTCFKDVVSLS